MDTQPTSEYARRMSTRLATLQPARYFKAAGVVFALLAVLFVFMVAKSRPPLWLLEAGMFGCLSGMLAWPPKTFRMASVWLLWLATGCLLVWSLIRPLFG